MTVKVNRHKTLYNIHMEALNNLSIYIIWLLNIHIILMNNMSNKAS